MKISIIIRAKNEAEGLKKLLPQIKRQKGISQKDVEIVIVDNDSSDGTRKIALNFARVINITDAEFSYPKALNFGIEKSRGDIVVIIAAHVLLINDNWLQNIVRHFSDPRVAGVYSPELPGANASIWEKIFYNSMYLTRKITSPDVIKKARPGVMAAVNCAVRKSVWQKHKFNENFGAGGEDLEWGIWALKNNYKIIRDTSCTVRHSHGLNLKNFIIQYKYWRFVRDPHPFDRGKIKYRNSF